MATPAKAAPRIQYIDGLKLIMCYMIMLIHFTIAYFPDGYISFGSNYTAAERIPAFWDGLPYSIYTNSPFPLHIFFALAAVLPTISFFRSKEPYISLQRQAIKRYFRFMIPVAAAIIGTSLLHTCGILDFKELAQLNNSPWCLSIEPKAMPWPTLLYHALVQCYFENGGDILTVMWCMYIIFLGSMLTLALLALFGSSPFRKWLYLASVLLLLAYPTYASFIVGIACGDFYVHHLEKSSFSNSQKALLSWLLLTMGIIIGYMPDFLFPAPITPFYAYAVASGMIILSLMFNSFLQGILSKPFLVHHAKYSFSVLLVHICVLAGVSKYIYQALQPLTNSHLLSFALCFSICVVITQLLAMVFYQLFEKPSQALADFVYQATRTPKI